MDDLSSMTVVQLKKELRSRSLKTSGKKADLVLRLRAAIDTEEEESQSNNNNNNSNDSNDNTNTNSFADFEEYINDEYNRLNNKDTTTSNNNTNTNNTNDTPNDIEELLNTSNTKEVQEEKDIILNTTTTPGNNNNNKSEKILSDFNVSCDPNALNNKSKMEDRRNRFGTQNTNDQSKIESRKRRFNSTTTAPQPPIKKQRIDIEAEKNKVLERAKKYGTQLPKGFKLTAEQSKVLFADKIERAKRFGTQHLLPKQLKTAEDKLKVEERKKRFNITSENKKEKVNTNIISAGPEKNSTKLMERKLRFGGIGEDENMNNSNTKKLNKRQFRNNEKFKQFRAYKKNNKTNNRNNNRGRGRGRGRGRRGGGRGGYRNYNKGNGHGNGYRNNNKNNNGVFSAEDLEKINQRKMRFNSM